MGRIMVGVPTLLSQHRTSSHQEKVLVRVPTSVSYRFVVKDVPKLGFVRWCVWRSWIRPPTILLGRLDARERRNRDPCASYRRLP
jgi:hypothetical protein